MKFNKLVYFRLHLIVLLWGFTGVLGKLISIDSLPLVGSRMSIGFAFLLGILLLFNQKIWVKKKTFLHLIGVGFLIGIHWIFFFAAIKASNVSVALSTIATSSLFSIPIELVLNKKRLNWQEVVLGFLVAGCVGIIFLEVKSGYWLGILYGLLASFFGALFSVINANLQKQHEPTQIILYALLGGFILVSLAMLLLDYSYLNSFTNSNWQDWFWIVLLGTLFTVYPMIESVRLMQNISPFTLLLTINLEPVYAILLAYFIFGESEQMNWLFYVATLVMIVCIVVNSLLSNQKKKEAPNKRNFF